MRLTATSFKENSSFLPTSNFSKKLQFTGTFHTKILRNHSQSPLLVSCPPHKYHSNSSTFLKVHAIFNVFYCRHSPLNHFFDRSLASPYLSSNFILSEAFTQFCLDEIIHENFSHFYFQLYETKKNTCLTARKTNENKSIFNDYQWFYSCLEPTTTRKKKLRLRFLFFRSQFAQSSYMVELIQRQIRMKTRFSLFSGGDVTKNREKIHSTGKV
jgi:hypothetical protein